MDHWSDDVRIVGKTINRMIDEDSQDVKGRIMKNCGNVNDEDVRLVIVNCNPAFMRV